jgi:nitrogen fixation NifU-like protein
MVKGKTRKEAEELFVKFHELITGKLGDNPSIEDLGKLAVFAGVKEFPARVKCASLAWHTMHSALSKDEKVISTE